MSEEYKAKWERLWHFFSVSQKFGEWNVELKDASEEERDLIIKTQEILTKHGVIDNPELLKNVFVSLSESEKTTCVRALEVIQKYASISLNLTKSSLLLLMTTIRLLQTGDKPSRDSQFGDIELENQESALEKARKLINEIATLTNRLQKLGVIKSGNEITSDYPKWFCSVKFGLELCDRNKSGYDAISKFGNRIQIKSTLGSDIDFKTDFDGIQVDEVDYLLVVFMNETTWMIDSIYKVNQDVLKNFLSNDPDKKFEWRRESRSLSLQLYPDDDNTLPPVF